MRKNKIDRLTEKQKKNIEEAINDRIDGLEDGLNEMFEKILIDIGLGHNQEALLYAREIFYRG